MKADLLKYSPLAFCVCLAIGCSEDPKQQASATPQPTSNQADKIPRRLSVYCTPSEVAPFYCVAVEFMDGKYRYWTYTDVVSFDEPEFKPIEGKWSVDGDKVLLDGSVAWYFEEIKGVPVLFEGRALKIWKEHGILDLYHILLPIADPRFNRTSPFGEDSINQPSVATILGEEFVDPELKRILENEPIRDPPIEDFPGEGPLIDPLLEAIRGQIDHREHLLETIRAHEAGNSPPANSDADED